MLSAALLAIDGTWKQPRHPSTDERIKKLWYIYTMECYADIKRNASESIQMRWMSLEPIIQSEVSQKKEDKYSMLMHMCGLFLCNRRMVLMILFAGQQMRCRHKEQTYDHSEGGRRWDDLRV